MYGINYMKLNGTCIGPLISLNPLGGIHVHGIYFQHHGFRDCGFDVSPFTTNWKGGIA